MTTCIGYCNTMRSNLPPEWNNICSLTLCSPGTRTGAGSAMVRSLENSYLEAPIQLSQQYLYEKPWQKYRVMLASGVKEENFHLLIPSFEKISWCLFLSPSYWAHDHKYFSLARPSGKLLLNCFWIYVSLGSSPKIVMVMQECQWMKTSSDKSLGPTRVILLTFHFMFSWMMQNMKTLHAFFFSLDFSWSSGDVLGMKVFCLLTVFKALAISFTAV